MSLEQYQAECAAGKIKNLKVQIVVKNEAIKDLFLMMDEGLLVRDTTNDSDASWAINQFRFVSRLSKAQQALSSTGSELLEELKQLREWFNMNPSLLQHTLKRYREALGLLYDHQNGCPLPKYEEGWNNAMTLAKEALGR